MAGGKRRGWTWETRKGGTTRRRKTNEYSGALNGGEGRAPVSGVGKGWVALWFFEERNMAEEICGGDDEFYYIQISLLQWDLTSNSQKNEAINHFEN